MSEKSPGELALEKIDFVLEVYGYGPDLMNKLEKERFIGAFNMGHREGFMAGRIALQQEIEKFKDEE